VHGCCLTILTCDSTVRLLTTVQPTDALFEGAIEPADGFVPLVCLPAIRQFQIIYCLLACMYIDDLKDGD
jgi:hypothetical protein